MPLILWTIRLSAVCYAAAIAAIVLGRPARRWWAAGCALYLAHVAAAFHSAYHWSHAAAVRETARQTEAMFGIASGAGIWWNYLFTAVWTADALWWLASPETRDRRPRWLSAAIHAYIAFLFVNGAIVFPHGPIRWLSAAAAAALAILWVSRRSVVVK